MPESRHVVIELEVPPADELTPDALVALRRLARGLGVDLVPGDFLSIRPGESIRLVRHLPPCYDGLLEGLAHGALRPTFTSHDVATDHLRAVVGGDVLLSDDPPPPAPRRRRLRGLFRLK